MTGQLKNKVGWCHVNTSDCLTNDLVVYSLGKKKKIKNFSYPQGFQRTNYTLVHSPDGVWRMANVRSRSCFLYVCECVKKCGKGAHTRWPLPIRIGLRKHFAVVTGHVFEGCWEIGGVSRRPVRSHDLWSEAACQKGSCGPRTRRHLSRELGRKK